MWSFLGDQSSERQWKACGCCHVRTATAVLGMWHMVLHVIAFGILAVVLLHPEKLERGGVMSPADMKTEGGRYSVSVAEYLHSQKYTFEDLNVGLLITFCTLCITIMLLYGTVRAKPSYLLPFFCLQMFDLFVTCLGILSYLSFVPDVHRIISQTHSVPFREWLLTLDSQWLAIIVLLFFTMAVTVKAYFLWVVWSCYKYLCWRQSGLRSMETAREGVMIRVGESVLDPDYVKGPIGVKYAETEPLTTVRDPPPPYTPADDKEPNKA